ncbi:TetR/AcrR family transcriptional regulator [Vallitalea pronyensis]|uniref:TetR/AcrR family transcriptional regulator n=1 Tax=Vallitalea pronyensis TaxID=1348613 RepID=A0A8J8SG09_9FIRM|nr:TetR/AcrR family transcriptional regulator [Vallitalea pronyensis]QUI21808.1 TetR/AcrR family transcriptional regulator [Vallitalea pronyensis]
MPRAFTQEELEKIRAKLLSKGKILFEKYGYKKFGIRDLTSEVGIANGMFYRFFESKETFFLEIIRTEKYKIRKRIAAEIMKHKDNPAKALKCFYRIIVKELYENALMNTILHKNEYSFILENMSSDDMIDEREKSLELIVELMNDWKSKHLMKDIDAVEVIGAIRSLVYLNFHKEEIGLDQYDAIIDFLLNRICDYAIIDGGRDE